MKKQALNTVETQVFEACVKAEGASIEYEIWFEDIRVEGLSVNQLKGYIGQLVQKGWLKAVGEDKYPTYVIPEHIDW